MFEGFFRIAFTGTAGSGFGLIALENGVVVGADVTGATYDGSYTSDSTTRQHVFQIDVNFPAGVTPVQTGIPLAAPLCLPMSGTILEQDLDNQKPTLVKTPLGPVNVLFSKIRDFHR